MDFLMILGAGVLGFFSWIVWAIVVGIVFFAAVGIPWAIWEGFMFLTFNNIINAFAKLPSFIGAFFGFVLTVPFAIVSVGVCVWAYAQTILMGILTFRGDPSSEFCQTFIEKMVLPWESKGCHSFVIVRYYYEHCQWLWGGAGFEHSWFPWQNGCGQGWGNLDFWWPVGETLPVEFKIIKLILLALPYLALFVLPIIPLVWSLFRPIVGALSALPAVSGNGDGRD